jgi:hypothetical protein
MNEKKDRRLIKENALILLPSLAETIGLSEAILVQQIHYWLEVAKENSQNYHDGHVWTYNSAKEWRKQFPFWSEETIRRRLHGLTKKGILIIGNYNKLNIDRTLWYRVDYEVLSRFLQTVGMERKEETSIDNDSKELQDSDSYNLSYSDSYKLSECIPTKWGSIT